MKDRKDLGVSKGSRDKQMMAYILADAFESAWVDHKESLENEGFRVAFSTQKAANAIIKGFNEIHRVARGDRNNSTDREVQETIGAMGDIALAFVALMIDRCDSTSALFKMYNEVKVKYPSKVGMDLNRYERNAFSEIGAL